MTGEKSSPIQLRVTYLGAGNSITTDISVIIKNMKKEIQQRDVLPTVWIMHCSEIDFLTMCSAGVWKTWKHVSIIWTTRKWIERASYTTLLEFGFFITLQWVMPSDTLHMWGDFHVFTPTHSSPIPQTAVFFPPAFKKNACVNQIRICRHKAVETPPHLTTGPTRMNQNESPLFLL